MYGGASRATELDPSELFSLVEELLRIDSRLQREVLIRRFISALYYAVFHYWWARKYDAGVKSRRGTDEWSYSEFIEDLAREGHQQIITIYK